MRGIVARLSTTTSYSVPDLSTLPVPSRNNDVPASRYGNRTQIAVSQHVALPNLRFPNRVSVCTTCARGGFDGEWLLD